MTSGRKQRSYGSFLQSMLDEERPTGQGGRLDAGATQAARAGDRVLTACYTFLANAVMDVHTFRRGQDLLVEAVRNWGRYRGEVMRREMLQRGIPATVENLMRFYDNADSEEPELDKLVERRTATPLDQAHSTPWCPMYDVWGELPVQPAVPQLLCTEVHRVQARAVNPSIRMSHPGGVLTSGADACHFRFEMGQTDYECARSTASRHKQELSRQSGPAMSRFEADTKDNVLNYRLQARLTALLYHFIVDILIYETSHEAAEAIAREAMRKWGQWRGDEMKHEHRLRGWPLTVENLIRYSDDPSAGDAWTAGSWTLEKDSYHVEITYSPYTWIFLQMGTPSNLASFFWVAALDAQAQAYNPGIRFRAPSLMERGDGLSVLEYWLEKHPT
jgi:hypothetical protein